MRIFLALIAATAVMMASAGCSSKSATEATGADAWKKTAPPAGYAAEVAAHQAAGAPSGGAPATPPAKP